MHSQDWQKVFIIVKDYLLHQSNKQLNTNILNPQSFATITIHPFTLISESIIYEILPVCGIM